MEGDYEAALRWLQTPLKILENKSPLQHAKAIRSEDVLTLIGRLENGVFS
ncbi:MAG: DUF2384 domain-containing protein [Moraxellaceae bacterium]|nr:MAG: DUF2384 domain-containing protein [Moraxellaceae bacterium]